MHFSDVANNEIEKRRGRRKPEQNQFEYDDGVFLYISINNAHLCSTLFD